VHTAGSESLVYFSLSRESKGSFDCPSFTRLTVEEQQEQDEEEGGTVGTVSVKRSAIEALHFSELTTREQLWYQQQVEADLLKRFEVNFPVLFTNQGCDMLQMKIGLLKDPSQTEVLIERLAQSVDAVKAMSKASPKLSAANNSALMVAAVLHKNLSESKERGWYKKYQELIVDMCDRCDLTASTIVRFQKVGELMLRCDVVACLLPSFLLDDEEAAGRLEDVFRAKLHTFFEELGESSVLQRVAGNKSVLQLTGSNGQDALSPLELQARYLLTESGTAGQHLLALVQSDGTTGKGTKAAKRK
jgi:hypothetical protein